MKKYAGIYSTWFCGNDVSDYGKENGYVDYATLAKSFDCVLNNGIISNTRDIGYWDCVNGSEYDEDSDDFIDVFQYYIISDSGYEILSDYTDEIVWYNEGLDMYVWGVTHYGTSWNYVLTDIRINLGEEAFNRIDEEDD